jgi:hypothetical protein
MVKHTKPKLPGILSSARLSQTWTSLKAYLSAVSKIVLGVSVSIWLNNLNESWHESKIARNFLHGIETDLKSDLQEMMEDSASLKAQFLCAQTIFRFTQRDSLLKDSVSSFLTRNNALFRSTTLLTPNIGRYEGMKSSGQLRFIENDSLSDHITNLYEERLPWLVMGEKEYLTLRQEFIREVFLRNGYNPDKPGYNNLKSTIASGYLGILTDKLSNSCANYNAALRETRKIMDMVKKELNR